MAWPPEPKPGVQSADATQRRPLARPGQVDNLDQDHRQLKQRFEDSLTFDAETWSGNFPRGGRLLLVDATAGAVNVPLPAAAKQRNRQVTIKKIDASANAVTLTADGTETIDGAATKVLAAQWDTITLASTGDAWWVIK